MVVVGGKEEIVGAWKMRICVMMLAAFGVTACTQTVPDSGAGVGFQDYNSYVKGRSAATAAQPDFPQSGTGAPLSGFSTGGAAAAIDNAEGVGTAAAPLGQQTEFTNQTGLGQTDAGAVRARGNAPAGIVETTSEMDAVNRKAAEPGSVSDEQDFDAVKSRETIESDKARIERNRATLQVDQPGALPERNGKSGPNIVEFALSTTHAVGTQMYKRSSLRLTSAAAACGKFPSPDLAQEAFLAAGGPDRDRKGLDPDGDGFACGWNPVPFRQALQ